MIGLGRVQICPQPTLTRDRNGTDLLSISSQMAVVNGNSNPAPEIHMTGNSLDSQAMITLNQ